MALGSTQPLTEMSTRSISWGKDGRCVRLTNYQHPVPLSRNLGTLTSWNPLGLSRPVVGLICFYLHVKYPILMNSNFLERFSKKKWISNFFKIHPIGAQLLQEYGLTDTTKLTVAFRILGKRLKYSQNCKWLTIMTSELEIRAHVSRLR